MALIRYLKNKLGNIIFPITKTKAVYDDNDNSLDDILSGKFDSSKVISDSLLSVTEEGFAAGAKQTAQEINSLKSSKQDKTSAMASISSPGWYRIAKYNVGVYGDAGQYVVRGSDPNSVIFKIIKTSGNTAYTDSIIGVLASAYRPGSSTYKFTILDRYTNYSPAGHIQKLRYTSEYIDTAYTGYLEVYCTAEAACAIGVELTAANTNRFKWEPILQPILTQESVDGVTVYGVCDLTQMDDIVMTNTQSMTYSDVSTQTDLDNLLSDTDYSNYTSYRKLIYIRSADVQITSGASGGMWYLEGVKVVSNGWQKVTSYGDSKRVYTRQKDNGTWSTWKKDVTREEFNRLNLPSVFSNLYINGYDATIPADANKPDAMIITGWSITNAPVASGVIIVTLPYGGTSFTHCTQLCFLQENTLNIAYRRTCINGTWTPWQKDANSEVEKISVTMLDEYKYSDSSLFRFYRKGGIVMVTFPTLNGNMTAGIWYEVCPAGSIPEKFRPYVAVTFTVWQTNGNSCLVAINIKENGSIHVLPYANVVTAINTAGTFTYIAANSL